MRIRRFLSVIAFSFAVTDALAQDCYESTVQSPSPFLGNDGEIVKLSDGSLWEIKYEYSYLYAYYPQVIICPNKGKLAVGSKMLNVTRVGTRKPAAQGKPRPSAKNPEPRQSTESENVIESRIEGDFQGWEGETIFKLANGQIWQQSVYAYTYHYAYRPEVMIYRTEGGYKMKVAGVDKPISVRRID